MHWPSGSCRLATLNEDEVLSLLAAAARLCAAWQRLANEQFAALSLTDPGACSAIQAEQLALLEQMRAIDLRWQQHVQANQSSEGQSRPAAPPASPALSAARAAFHHEARRALAADRRNVKALRALSQLAGALNQADGIQPISLYNRRGALAAARDFGLRTINREG